MYKEHTKQPLWRHHKTMSATTRYRDDIWMLFGERLTNEEVRAVQEKMQKVFGNSLLIELEKVRFTEIPFLESIIITTPNGLKLRNNNKNINILNPSTECLNGELPIVRYPHPQANWPESIYIATMIGTLHRLRFNSTEGYLRNISVIQHVIEWKMRGYDASAIKRAIKKADVLSSNLRTLLFSTLLQVH
jgi:hypothetical protein